MKFKFLSMMLFLALSMCLFSCSSVKTLQGYYENTYTIESSKSFDEVWDNVIDYFAQNAIPISMMEKDSGLIISTKVSVPQTVEVNGKPYDPNAFVVVPNYNIKNIATATMTFNVRVRKYDEKIKVTVTTSDVQGYYWQLNTITLMSDKVAVNGSSTGVFERRLAELIAD